MAELESVELGRAMHQRGMERFQGQKFATDVHPIGALSIVHNVLIIPEVADLDSLDTAYTILTNRLGKPNALKWRNPSVPVKIFEQFQRGFAAIHPPEDYEIRDNMNMWIPAMEIIGTPIDPSEVEGQAA